MSLRMKLTAHLRARAAHMIALSETREDHNMGHGQDRVPPVLQIQSFTSTVTGFGLEGSV